MNKVNSCLQVSQNVRQGTVNPTSYNVIKDESGFNPDKIQLLTYKVNDRLSSVSCVMPYVVSTHSLKLFTSLKSIANLKEFPLIK